MGALVLLFVATVVVSFATIYGKVAEVATGAMERYDADAVSALHSLALDESASYVERNDAVYALGQIGSKRSLPVLRRLDTYVEQEKPLDRSRYIVQYEVEKAITQIGSSFIVTRWMYGEFR
jgi:hypothetical protein